MILLFADSQAEALEGRAAFLRDRLPGFTISHVADPVAAAAWIARAQALDVLVTEAIFDEDHTGFELRDVARARFPHVRVLFTTRFDLSEFDEQVAGESVLKDSPYSHEKLLLRVQALLSEPVDASAPQPVMVPGTVLGSYQVLDRLYIENEAETYRAMQVSVQRPVALVLLKPEFLNQPEVVAKFRERIRVKAGLEYARIAPLFEAGEANGWLFYTRELPRGRTLEELEAADEHLSERRLAEVLHGIAEAMEHATTRGYHHRSLAPRDIYIDGDHHSSITNIFRQSGTTRRDAKADVRALLHMLRPIAAEGKARGMLTALENGHHDWSGLLETLDDIRDAMREHSIVKKIEAETLPTVVTSSGGRPWWVWLIFASLLALIAGVGALTSGGTGGKNRLISSKAATMPQVEQWAHIPAGPFVYQEQLHKPLAKECWISKHEVTLGQYAEFLAALKKGPTGQYDHPEQPKTKKGHTPPHWDAYMAAAVNGTPVQGEPVSIHTPVTEVDWFDAYAYAKWRGMRLPTELEWEKAARGDKGRAYPWGDADVPGAANLGDDYSDKPGVKGGTKDGHNFAAAVTRDTRDVSPYDVREMAGNVQEWTAGEQSEGDWPLHPDYPDLRVPVVRGGHFGMKSSDQLLTDRRFPDSAMEAVPARGFRVVRDTPP